MTGAGFDPRSTRIVDLIPPQCRANTQAILLREERPNPERALLELAIQNRDALMTAFSGAQEHFIQVFAEDNAVIGGRSAARIIRSLPLKGITDIFVDISALSIGIAFPIIKHFMEVLSRTPESVTNLHVLSCDSPPIDRTIRSRPSDRVAPILGFHGEWGLHTKSHAAILWMPQLSHGKGGVLRRIFQFLINDQPDTVVCPILPFPSSRPRLPDELLEEFADELQAEWSVDVRDLVYADEKSPLDLYRTILRIDDARKRVFASVGGSQIVLSPIGSKALSLGALMAALERNFTILHVESIGYTVEEQHGPPPPGSEELVHIWLHGEAYGIKGAE
ncbi:MAG: hypothetical protein IT428_03365 [Planctomycetaceae bacterium]|nr:hypothetical protein [Planctomycetaceae bacterium]